MSSTDATTADGFRVGRRVRYRWNHECRGEITAKTAKHLEWEVTWDSGEYAPSLQDDLILLPDDEPDAPATPEPDHSVDANKLAEPAPAHDPTKDHYAILRERGFEPWDVMQASFPADWCLAYNVLTALAYLQRCTLKHPTPDDDIRKAHDHLAEAVRIVDSKSA